LALTADTPHGYLAEQHLLFMNDYLPERIAFSYRELDAAMWIVEELLAMGYTWYDIEVQTFSGDDVAGSPWGWGQIVHPFDIGDHLLRDYSQNVILTVPGQSAYTIVVGAHYDGLLYPGASDNASGTVLLLESAQRMLHLDNYYTIVYVFFGAEEIGLFGAYYYVDRLSDEELDAIVLMVNADVLLDGDTLFYAAGYVDFDTPWGEAEVNARTELLDQIADDLNAQYDMGLTAIPEGVYLPSDHLPFLAMGHTVMVLFGAELVDGGFAGNFYLDVFHSPRDDVHYLRANMPGRIERGMWVFSTFLENVLLQQS